MTGIFQISILLAATVTAILGLGVFLTNSKRAVNQHFLIMCLAIVGWLTCQWNALFASDEESIVFWIKQANAAGALLPLCFNLLRLAIVHSTKSWLQIFYIGRYWILTYIPVAILCQTSFLLEGLKDAPDQIHVPAYGPGMGIYSLYFLSSLVYMIYRFIRDLKTATGIARTEIQFTLLGCGASLFLGISFAVIIPLLTGHTNAVQFSPLSMIVLDGFIAYGIATGRIMGVENVLRTVSAYVLLTAYLVALYIGVHFIAHWLLTPLMEEALPIPELISTLVVAFSMAPMHGRMQKFANRLFVTWQATDVQKSASQASAILQTISTLDDLMERFSDLVCGTFGTDSVRIFIHEEDTYRQIHPAPEGGAPPLSADHPVVQICRAHPEAVATELMKRTDKRNQDNRLIQELQHLKAAAAVGIRSKGRLDGIILVGSRLSGRIYGKQELETLQVLASQLAVALDNAQLYTELQNSKIYNDILLDNMISGVVAVNNSGRVTVFNREAQRITNLSAGATLHRLANRLPEQIYEPLNITLEQQQSMRDIETSILNAEGVEIPLRIGTSLFHSHEGDVLGALAVINDVSKIRQLETQIRRTDRLASLGTLSAGMAHEIKNPLVSIKTFTDLLPERYDDSDFRETFSDLVGHEVTRIDSIVNQLLTFARPAKPNLTALNLDEVLERCTRLVEQQLHVKGIELHTNLNAGEAQVKGDPDLLQQVFINFLLNAIESMEAGGVLTVETSMDQQTSLPRSSDWNQPQTRTVVRVLIRDTGKGIAPSNLSRIFDPFFTTKSNGTGMGLAVTYSILQDHDATVDVQSEPGRGASFRIDFATLSEQVPAS